MPAATLPFARPRVRWAYRALVGVFVAALALPVLFRQPGDWETAYLPAADRLRTGDDIFAWGSGYVYPPLAAFVAVPFAMMPPGVGRVAWAAVNVAAGFVFLRLAWRLTGGHGLPGAAGTGRVDHAAFWLGAGCAAGFILDVVGNRQTDLVIAALLLGGCTLLARNRSVAAGWLFGLAAAVNCTPLLFAPYLMWKGKWAGALALVAVAVGVNLLPDVLYLPPDGRPRVRAWAGQLLVPMAGKDFDPGVWASGIGFNHSVAGVANRWLTAERIVIGEWAAPIPSPDRIGTADLKRVVYGAEVVLLVTAVAVTWRRATPASSLAVECGIVFTLMLLLSPMSSKPHFCILLVPQLALVRLGWARRDRFVIGLTVVAALAGMMANKDVVGKPAYEFLVWNGAVFGNALVLFVGCCYARWRYADPGEPAVTRVPAPVPFARAA